MIIFCDIIIKYDDIAVTAYVCVNYIIIYSAFHLVNRKNNNHLPI